MTNKYARPWPWEGYTKLGYISCIECHHAICTICEDKNCFTEGGICVPPPREERLILSSHRHDVFIKDKRISIWWRSSSFVPGDKLEPAGNLYCQDCGLCEKPHWQRVYTLHDKPYIYWDGYYTPIE